MAAKNILKFCITHDVPTYPLDEDAVVIWLGDGKSYESLKNNVVVVRNIYPDLDFYRPYLLGSAGTFAVRRVLESLGHVPMDLNICLQSYRKIVTNIPIGTESSTYPGMRVVGNKEAYDPTVCVPKATDYLLPKPIFIGHCIAQYARAHKIEDFLRYIALAVEIGVLADYADAELFMHSDVLVPGGIELGVFPYTVFMEISSALERVAIEFCRRYRPADLGLYNRRAASFCSERLGSYLLLKKFSQSGRADMIEQSVGYMTVFTSEGEYLANDM